MLLMIQSKNAFCVEKLLHSFFPLTLLSHLPLLMHACVSGGWGVGVSVCVFLLYILTSS